MASALLYVLATAVMGRNVLAALATRIANDPGDPILNAAILKWNADHVPWTDAWFQFPIFHPTANALTLSEHLLGASVLASPIYWVTQNPLVAYNLTLLLAYPLSGLAMYALVWRLTRRPGAAFVAGLAFAFAPYRVSHLPQIQVQIVFWAPLALLGLHAFVESASRRFRWLVLFAVCWMLQGASNGYFLVYFSVLAGFWVLWFVVARQRWRDLAWIAAATGVAVLPLIPILYRYLTAQRDLGLSRNLGEIASYGADIGGVLCAAPALTFWGWLDIACGAEGELFAGIACVAAAVAWRVAGRTGRAGEAGEAGGAGEAGLAGGVGGERIARVVRRLAIAISLAFVAIAVVTWLAGPWRFEIGPIRISASSADKPLSTAAAFFLIAFALSRTLRDAVRRGAPSTFYVGAAVICWVLSWGPFPRLFGVEVLYQAPFAWLLQLPGVDGLRVPARFWMMTVLCLSVFVGLASARVLARRRGAALVTLFALLALADGWTTIPVADVPGEFPDRGTLRGRTVLSLPIGDLYPDLASAYRAVTGGWRSINGYSGFEPGYYEALRTLSPRADPALLRPFVERSDLQILVDETAVELRAMIEREPGVEFVGRQGGALQYRLRQQAATAAAPLGRRIEVRSVSASCDPAGLPFVTDLDMGTSWICGAQVEDQQLTVETGDPVTAGALVLAFGPHGTGFPRELIVETSPDGTAWEAAWEGSPAALVLRAALESPRETRVALHFRPRTARSVRLRQIGRDDRYWSIAELEVWTGPET